MQNFSQCILLIHLLSYMEKSMCLIMFTIYYICVMMSNILDLWICSVPFLLKTTCKHKKKLVRKGDKPLQQICKRLTEKENTLNSAGHSLPKNDFELFIEHSDGPLIDMNIKKQYKQLKFPNYV